MIRRSLSRFRQIAPPTEVITVYLGIFALPQGLLLYLEWRNIPIGAHLHFQPGWWFLLLGCVHYGLGRVTFLHPVWQSGYLAWLKLTPWTVQKPLPLGPVELVLEDALIMGPIILLSAVLPEPHALRLVCAFLLSHLLVLTVTLWLTRTWAIAYLTAFGLGLAVWLWRSPLACLGTATLVYLLAYQGLRESFERFPWESRKLPSYDPDLANGIRPADHCGWPVDRVIREVTSAPTVSRIDAVLSCMLLSWWLFVLSSHVPDRDNRVAMLTMVFVGLSTTSSLARLVLYMQGYRSPISLWARIRTFRWLIPGYDQIFVTPICAALAGPLATVFLLSLATPLDVCLSLASGVCVLFALIGPPSLKRWRLTGRHRIACTLSEANKLFVKVG
jgi:hypothetical protein